MINEEFKEEKVVRANEANREEFKEEKVVRANETARVEEKPEAPELPTVQRAKPVLHIQYGSFHLELPGEIDIDSVAGILREIQKTLL